MSYTVLARKYRPRNFSELVGQAHVVQALGNALTTQRLHHAYLFTGTRGVGKTTISRILAKSLNCVGTDGQGGITDQPCGVCQACVDIDQGRFVDYTELDAASNRGVDEVQSLLEQAVYKPVQGRFKVFMIDEVHMLTNTAFNAMLKTLEEPPEYLKFVLATTDPQKVPVTVLSRCLQFNLRPMPPDTIVAHLEQVLADESVPFEVGALRYVARAAQGSMRDALSLTDQAIAYGNGALNEEPVRKMLGAVDRSHVLGLIEGLALNEGARVVAMVDEARIQGLSAATLLEEMASTLQRMAVIQVTGEGDTTDPDHASLMALAEAMPADETQLLYSLCIHGRADLGLAPDEYAALTMVLLRLLAFKPGAVQASTEKKSPNLRPKPLLPSEPQASEPEPESQGMPPFDVIEPTSDAIESIAPEAVVPDEVLEPLVVVPVKEATPDELMVRHTPSVPEGLLTTPEGDVWFTTVQRLLAEERVTALVRELALQAQLVAIDESVTPAHWLLRIERESLNQGATRERLATALNEAGIVVTLAVELGLVQDTPAKRIAFATEQKLADARAVMENDPFVQHMMRDFGATIVPGTLKPQEAT
ncbi:MAG: DNA polymerase III subunit gamma/tau [Burkholderiaceae bacterium]